jgi:ketosteroid isomerase-like protein
VQDGLRAILSSVIIPGGVPERQHLILEAFEALDKGELEPFKELLDPDAKWVAIPQSETVAETPTCVNRAAILNRLKRVHENGRRFRVGKLIEGGNRVAVEVTVLSPEWSDTVTLYRVFTFDTSDAVVRLNDCIDESYALQVLVA